MTSVRTFKASRALLLVSTDNTVWDENVTSWHVTLLRLRRGCASAGLTRSVDTRVFVIFTLTFTHTLRKGITRVAPNLHKARRTIPCLRKPVQASLGTSGCGILRVWPQACPNSIHKAAACQLLCIAFSITVTNNDVEIVPTLFTSGIYTYDSRLRNSQNLNSQGPPSTSNPSQSN